MTAPLHIMFSPLAAGSLRQGLEQAGRDDQVVAYFDDLSFGPIDPPDLDVRRAWDGEELGYDDYDLSARMAAFWTAALAPGRRRIVWVTRRSPKEYAGLLEFLRQIGDEPFEIIDLTDVAIEPTAFTEERIGATWAIHPGEFLQYRLFERASPLSPEDRVRYADTWSRLRAENAPLRVIENGELCSAPMTYFDAQLLSAATGEWRRAAYLVGVTLVEIWETSFYQTGDLVLFARVRALVDSGDLEGRGDLTTPSFEVRLPSR